jgi:ribonucleotide monophosphatase NagD (HAD superfamily)
MTEARTKTYCFDIDGTLCTNTWGKYEDAEPIPSMIAQVNTLYEAGHRIILFTARGTMTGIDWRSVTEEQMARWHVHYHELHFGKPQADVYIDDRAMSLQEWAAKAPEHIDGLPSKSGV